MSSLSAARADNYYYPREWRPEHGSINKFQNSHPLGKRAKDIADGVLVVRFEMPFNVWCTHCDTHIGRGVRYNAKKKKCGMYFTTILYEFVLTCAHCQGDMVIRTDPENRGYNLVSGVKKQTHGADDAHNDDDDDGGGGDIAHAIGTEKLNDPQIGMQLASDPFFKLEHDNEDKRVAAKRAQGLDALLELKDAHDKDNYASNSSLRATFRSQKKQIKKREAEAHKLGLAIPLLDVHHDDVVAAKAVVYKNIPGKRSGSVAASSRVAGKGRSDQLIGKATSSKRAAATLSSSARAPASADSFQHFGDAMGSQLHRLKMSKLAAQKKAGTGSQSSASASGGGGSSKKRKACGSGTSLAVRARTLLRR